MKGIDKTSNIDPVVAGIGDGASIMIGGFGVPGTPFTLIHALLDHGQRELTLIKNDANESGMGIDHLIKNGRVRKLITSHIGLNPRAIAMMNSGELEIELCSQGILAERIRAAGAGLFGILTDIGLGTPLAKGKPTFELGDQTCIVEPALEADYAFIHADSADPFGNLQYCASARNFNPLMAQAAKTVIVEAEQIVAPGTLRADAIHTPGPFVDHVIQLPELTQEYAVVRR